jgi:hypothetical protein
MERVMGIEPTTSAWKAEVLPVNYTRIKRNEAVRKKKGLPIKGNRFSSVLLIPVAGVEPALLAEHDFESCASANSATPA